MRKGTLTLLVLLILTGCSAQAVDYEASVHQALARPLPRATNRTKTYFKYYLLPSVGVKEATQVSTYFVIDGSDIMIDLDVPNVIARKHKQIEADRIARDADDEPERIKLQFKSLIHEDSAVLRKEGTYVDAQDNEQHYILSVLDLGVKKGIVLENGYVHLLAVSYEADIDTVIHTLFMTMRSVVVNEDLVVRDFSKKDIITYHERYEDFFEHAVPESGAVSDIMDKTNPAGNP